MPITEASRHQLIGRLEEALGEEAAMTLAEHLPPVGWADVATKADLANQRESLTLAFESALHRELLKMFGIYVGVLLSVAAAIIGAVAYFAPQ